MIAIYYSLTKPGIIGGNLLTASAGFFLASKNHFDPALFLITLLGLSCIIASACAFNNYIDRHADSAMERTRHRPLAKQLISPTHALLFATALVVSGTLLLTLFTNPLTVAAALSGFFIYVVCYSFAKYHTIHATLIGSIAGATPPVVGYFAVTQTVDAAAAILFAIIVLWQMPHFFAIAIYRLNEYRAASIPIFPLKKSLRTTKLHMLFYILAFTFTSPLLSVYQDQGPIYATISILLGLTWFALGLKGFRNENDSLWARRMFLFSLAVVTLLSFALIF